MPGPVVRHIIQEEWDAQNLLWKVSFLLTKYHYFIKEYLRKVSLFELFRFPLCHGLVGFEVFTVIRNPLCNSRICVPYYSFNISYLAVCVNVYYTFLAILIYFFLKNHNFKIKRYVLNERNNVQYYTN